jgi:uncharacterized protein YdbL (DUF1318 family)
MRRVKLKNSNLGFRISDLFRISIFEFRIYSIFREAERSPMIPHQGGIHTMRHVKHHTLWALLVFVAGYPKGQLQKAAKIPPGKKKVIRALQRVSFNKDDIDQYKKHGVLGENNQGGITLLASDKVAPDQLPFVENLVQEENADREVVMRRVIETNEKLSDKDWPRVKKMFAGLNRDKASIGHMIQFEDGKWTTKEKK